MEKMKIAVLAILALVLILFTQNLTAQVIILNNGEEISGRIDDEDRNNYYVTDQDGIQQIIPKSMVVEVKMEYHHQDRTPIQNSLYQYHDSGLDTKSYTSISFGYGNSYGGLGMRLQRKFDKIGLHGGVGWLPAPAEWADSAILFSGGLKFYLRNDQFYFNPQFGSFGIHPESHYYGSYEKILYGPSLLFGGDWSISENLGLNAALGLSYNLVDTEWIDELIFLALDLGFYVRF